MSGLPTWGKQGIGRAGQGGTGQGRGGHRNPVSYLLKRPALAPAVVEVDGQLPERRCHVNA